MGEIGRLVSEGAALVQIDFIPEQRSVSGTPTVLPDDGNRPPASEYKKGECEFTLRMENFYRNLLAMYRATGAKVLPIYFVTADGRRTRMDRGCIGHAVAEGFLAPLKDDEDGALRHVSLGW